MDGVRGVDVKQYLLSELGMLEFVGLPDDATVIGLGAECPHCVPWLSNSKGRVFISSIDYDAERFGCTETGLGTYRAHRLPDLLVEIEEPLDGGPPQLVAWRRSTNERQQYFGKLRDT